MAEFHCRDVQSTALSRRMPATQAGIQMDSGSGYAVGLVPAVEYNWRHNLGVILGTYAIVAGRNAAATITPVVAIIFFH